MTKYLLKGLFYSLLLYCLFGTRYVFAAAEDYYENVLRGAGLPIVSLTELKDAPHTPNQILLQLSSWQVTPEATKDYFTIIIICDNVFEYQNDFKCDRTSVISNNFPLTLVASSAEGRIEILDYRKEDVNILVIPEELLYTRTTRGSVLAYLTALNNKSLPQTALPSPASDAKQNLWLLRPSLMVQNLLILVIFGYLWTQVPKVNNIINIRSLVRFLSSGRSKATAVISGVSNFFQTNPLAAKVKKILSYLPVFLFCLTSIVFMTVSLKDTAKVDINYIDAYFSGLLNPLTLLPGQGSYFKLLLSWLLLLLTLTFVLVAWLRVLPFLQSFNMKSELNRPIHKSALKGGIVLPLLAWLLIFVSPLSSKYVVQTILLVTTLYLLILARRNKLILGSLYTNRERAFILTVGVLLAVLVGKYQPSQQEREKAGPPVPLITEQEAIAIFAYYQII
ncbi:hypothetical protein KJ605_01735 [Patescibacteria group bacterium]|nr:hypothetical protein [Patescibacteria group bacterium]